MAGDQQPKEIFVLPESITLANISALVDALNPDYSSLKEVSGEKLRQYDSSVFVYLLAIVRRVPHHEALVCQYFPESLQAMAKSYGLDAVFSFISPAS